MYDEDDLYDDDEEFHEDVFWTDFEYDFDGEDPFHEYDDLSPEWD